MLNTIWRAERSFNLAGHQWNVTIVWPFLWQNLIFGIAMRQHLSYGRNLTAYLPCWNIPLIGKAAKRWPTSCCCGSESTAHIMWKICPFMVERKFIPPQPNFGTWWWILCFTFVTSISDQLRGSIKWLKWLQCLRLSGQRFCPMKIGLLSKFWDPCVRSFMRWRPSKFFLNHFQGIWELYLFYFSGSCNATLGLESGTIEDGSLSASSSFDDHSTGPQNARQEALSDLIWKGQKSDILTLNCFFWPRSLP